MALGKFISEERKVSVRKGLERIATRYLPMATITACQTPLHEGLHSLSATILPRVHSEGVAINQSLWYAKPLSLATLGYFKSAELPQGVAGQALIAKDSGIIGNLGMAVVSAAPEVATMTLGFYWLKKAMDNINEKGERVCSLARAYCGMALVSSTFNYMQSSITNPVKGSDHVNFTRAVLDLMPIPFVANAAPLVTVIGAGAMLAGSLLIANKIGNRNKDATSLREYKFG